MSEHFIQANALNIPLADRSVQMCVTSPPYWGLRDYGTAEWIGGDAECDHKIDNSEQINTSTLGGSKRNCGNALAGYKSICAKCGAVRVDNQLGLERTPEEYVANMVAVFREVRRVLKDDGVLWLVIGDSYATQPAGNKTWGDGVGNNKHYQDDGIHQKKAKDFGSIKLKDLVGIPWRVAFALQADGWWLRSDVIWSKPNPMPESVTDRPTKAHEYIFLLTKSAQYYYDHEAIMEKNTIKVNHEIKFGGNTGHLTGNNTYSGNVYLDKGKRNKRSVWHVATAPYKGAHYATYPPKLIEPCILAGSKQGDIVFDPFNGSGTTGLVARKHGRNYIGTDLSLEYIHQAEERLSHTALKNWQRGKAVETTDLGPLFEVMA